MLQWGSLLSLCAACEDTSVQMWRRNLNWPSCRRAWLTRLDRATLRPLLRLSRMSRKGRKPSIRKCARTAPHQRHQRRNLPAATPLPPAPAPRVARRHSLGPQAHRPAPRASGRRASLSQRARGMARPSAWSARSSAGRRARFAWGLAPGFFMPPSPRSARRRPPPARLR
jgi:hypothetical protein